MLRELEQQVRLRRKRVDQEKEEVKKVAETLAETFDQKRKLKKAAKKILTNNMLQGLSQEEIDLLAGQDGERALDPAEAARKKRTPLRERRARREAAAAEAQAKA